MSEDTEREAKVVRLEARVLGLENAALEAEAQFCQGCELAAALKARIRELEAALRDISRRTRRGDPLGEIADAALKGGDAE